MGMLGGTMSVSQDRHKLLVNLPLYKARSHLQGILFAGPQNACLK